LFQKTGCRAQASEITSLLRGIKGKLSESHNNPTSSKQEEIGKANYKQLEETIKRQQQIINALQIEREQQTTKLRLIEDKLSKMEKEIEKNK
jgi:septal ring factor EnvC (AmiA/AmiB activator)